MKTTMLREKRNEIGISQKKLSDMSGVNFRLLQDYEQGRKKLLHAKAEMIYRLSVALDCSMESLLKSETIDIDEEYVSKEELLHRIKIYSTALSDPERIGNVGIVIDDIVPCLINNATGKEEETVVFKIESRSYLKNFNKTNGWHINWSMLEKEIEVYALALRKDNSIQGLIALRNDVASKATYIHWACTAPHNNISETGIQKYQGVGGHLFAIAADKSVDWGYGGIIHGFASCEKVLHHYIDKFNAVYLGMMHRFQFYIGEKDAKNLMEVYSYEWN